MLWSIRFSTVIFTYILLTWSYLLLVSFLCTIIVDAGRINHTIDFSIILIVVSIVNLVCSWYVPSFFLLLSSWWCRPYLCSAFAIVDTIAAGGGGGRTLFVFLSLIADVRPPSSSLLLVSSFLFTGSATTSSSTSSWCKCLFLLPIKGFVVTKPCPIVDCKIIGALVVRFVASVGGCSWEETREFFLTHRHNIVFNGCLLSSWCEPTQRRRGTSYVFRFV